jgi:hypothetical protein
MFSFHAVPFTLRLAITNPLFITSDDPIEGGVMPVTIAIQMLLADVQARLHNILGILQTLQNPSLLWMIS